MASRGAPELAHVEAADRRHADTHPDAWESRSALTSGAPPATMGVMMPSPTTRRFSARPHPRVPGRDADVGAT